MENNITEADLQAAIAKYPETFTLDGDGIRSTCRISKLYDTPASYVEDGAIWVRVDVLQNGTWVGWFVEEHLILLNTLGL